RDARRRPGPHPELAMARPRQRDRRDGGVDGRARRAAREGARLHLLRDVPRAAGAGDQAGEWLAGDVRPRAPLADLDEGGLEDLAATPLFLGADHGSTACIARSRWLSV